MVKEIYIRDESDPYFEPGILDYTNEMESVVSQVKMVLGTMNGDILGDYDFGVNLEHMVFNTRKSATEVQKIVQDQINEYVKHSSNVTVKCDISFGDSGRGYDYAILDIYINGRKSIGFLVDKD